MGSVVEPENLDQTLAREVPESKTVAHGAAAVFTSSFVYSLLSFGFYLIIVRILSTSVLGVFYSLTVVWGFATTFALLSLPSGFVRFVTASVQTDKMEEARYLFRRSVLASFGIVALATPLLILISPTISIWLFGSPDYNVLLYLVTIDFAINGLNSFLNIPLLATRRFFLLSSLQVVYGIIRFGFSVALLLHGSGIFSLIDGWIVSDAAYLIAFSYLALPFFRGSEAKTSLGGIIPYSMPLLISSGIVLALGNVDRLFVLKYLGTAALGVYGTILVAAAVPGLLPTAVGTALSPAVVRSEERDSLPTEFITDATRYISIITIPLLCLTAVLGNVLLNITLGPTFSAAWVSFAVLVAGNAVLSIDIPLGQVLMAKKKTRILGTQQIVSSGCIAVLAILFIPTYFLTGAALAYVLARAAGFAFIFPFLYRLGYFKVEWRAYAKILGATALTMGVTFLAQNLTGYSPSLIFVYLVVGGTTLILSLKGLAVLRPTDRNVITGAFPKSLRAAKEPIWQLLSPASPGTVKAFSIALFAIFSVSLGAVAYFCGQAVAIPGWEASLHPSVSSTIYHDLTLSGELAAIFGVASFTSLELKGITDRIRSLRRGPN